MNARQDLRTPRAFVRCSTCDKLRPINTECCKTAKPILIEKARPQRTRAEPAERTRNVAAEEANAAVVTALAISPSAQRFTIRCTCGWWTYEQRNEVLGRTLRHIRHPEAGAAEVITVKPTTESDTPAAEQDNGSSPKLTSWEELSRAAAEARRDNGSDKAHDNVAAASDTTTDTQLPDTGGDNVADKGDDVQPLLMPIPDPAAQAISPDGKPLTDDEGNPVTEADIDELGQLLSQYLAVQEPIWFISAPEVGPDTWRLPKCLENDDAEKSHHAEHEAIERLAHSGDYNFMYLCRECDHPIFSDRNVTEEERFCGRHRPK